MTDTTSTTAPLSVTSVNLTSPLGYNYRDVQVSIDGGTATIALPSGQSLGSKSGVFAWQHPNSDTWTVTFDDEDVWTLRRPGCGCGGRS